MKIVIAYSLRKVGAKDLGLNVESYPLDLGKLSGWRNAAEIVLFEISNSLKPYPSFFRAYIGKSRPVIGFSEQKKLIEVSNRIPPTSQLGPRGLPQPTFRAKTCPASRIKCVLISVY